jgi:hypothetical protein
MFIPQIVLLSVHQLVPKLTVLSARDHLNSFGNAMAKLQHIPNDVLQRNLLHHLLLLDYKSFIHFSMVNKNIHRLAKGAVWLLKHMSFNIMKLRLQKSWNTRFPKSDRRTVCKVIHSYLDTSTMLAGRLSVGVFPHTFRPHDPESLRKRMDAVERVLVITRRDPRYKHGDGTYALLHAKCGDFTYHIRSKDVTRSADGKCFYTLFIPKIDIFLVAANFFCTVSFDVDKCSRNDLSLLLYGYNIASLFGELATYIPYEYFPGKWNVLRVTPLSGISMCLDRRPMGHPYKMCQAYIKTQELFQL